MINLLLCAECAGGRLVAHFNEVIDGQGGQGVGVFFPSQKIFRKGTTSVPRKLRQTVVKHDTVFERCVHPLTVKRNNRMSGISQKRNLVFVAPGRTTNSYE